MNGNISLSRIGLGVAAFQLQDDWQHGPALSTLETAWQKGGLRAFDTSALYGGGVTEAGLGRFLRGKPADNVRVTTKCGRFRDFGDKPPRDGGTSDRRDFSADAARHSAERSLERLGPARIETVFIHDPDTPAERTAALEGAYPALRALADQGAIGGVGVATNQIETALAFLEHVPLDAVMLANSHSILAPAACDAVFAAAEKQGARVFIAGVFLSGILATGTAGSVRFRYGQASAAVLARVAALEKLAARYDISLRHLALAFLARDPRIDTVTLGAANPEQLAASLADLARPVPPALWQDLTEPGEL